MSSAAAVAQALFVAGPCSAEQVRRTISSLTGDRLDLSPQRVSRELIRLQLLGITEVCKQRSGSPGRPAELHRLNAAGMEFATANRLAALTLFGPGEASHRTTR